MSYSSPRILIDPINVAEAPRELRARPTEPAPSTKYGWTRTAIRADIAGIRKQCAKFGWISELTALHQPSPGVIFANAAMSWLIVLGAWWCVVRVSWAFLPLALVVIATRQRALGNALHDSAHGNGSRSHGLNQWLFAVPMFEDLDRYRHLHLLHHAYLGDEVLDPDFIASPSQRGEKRRSAGQIYARTVLSLRMWRESVLGQLPALGWVARGRTALWWCVFLLLLSRVGVGLGLGAVAALSFAGLWMLARATTYHLLKVFTELSDHVGLTPGSILSNTRNSPKNWLSALLHPHYDNYHLAHHLAPRVPMSQLPKLHALLLRVEAYRYGHHCDSYFLGSTSVVRSWCPAEGLAVLERHSERSISQGTSSRRELDDGGDS